MRRIVMAVGGTGGHLKPAMDLASRLKRCEVTFIGVGLSSNPYFSKSLSHISVSGGSLKHFMRIFRGIVQSWRALREIEPELVIGFGSYHSFPPLLAARLMGIPYMLYETNAAYGKVNRLFAPHASGVGSLLGELPYATRVRGPSVVREGKREKDVVLVFGGSQGAVSINRAVMAVAPKLDLEWIHIVGKKENVGDVEAYYHRHHIKVCVKPFEENMPLAYNRASFAICRAGSGSVAELIAHHLPAVLIPYPHASEGHQLANAQLFEQLGGGVVVEECALNSQTLLKAIKCVRANEDAMRSALEEASESLEEKISFTEMIEAHLGEL